MRSRTPTLRSAASRFRVLRPPASGSWMSMRRTSSGPLWKSRAESSRRCPKARHLRSPAWASMFSRRKFLLGELRRDAADPSSSHDLRQGHHSLSSSRTGRRSRTAFRAPASGRSGKKGAYWRDVGTVDAYWAANIDLTAVVPDLDIYDQDWPILDLQ